MSLTLYFRLKWDLNVAMQYYAFLNVYLCVYMKEEKCRIYSKYNVLLALFYELQFFIYNKKQTTLSQTSHALTKKINENIHKDKE